MVVFDEQKVYQNEIIQKYVILIDFSSDLVNLK